MTLVPADSPLRLVPTNLDRRTVLFLDGVRYSLHIIDAAAARLTLTLEALSSSNPDRSTLSERIASAMSDAWTMIDSTHRMRELLQQIPKLKKKQPELQLFLRRTTQAEELRHFVQHFRTEIESFSRHGLPLWGTLSWTYVHPETKELQNYTIAPGTFFTEVELQTCTFDNLQHKFVEQVLLHAGSARIDLAYLLAHISEFTAWYTTWFAEKFATEDHSGADVHLVLTVRPVQKQLAPEHQDQRSGPAQNARPNPST